jgi:carboxyl-terminal processing protease
MTSRISFAARWSLLCALMVALCPLAWADPVAPKASDREITRAVTLLVKQEHLLAHDSARLPATVEISHRCLSNLLKSLDPMKVYFYQSDIDGFMKQRDGLYDAINKGDLSFAYVVFRTFLQRVDERVKTVDQLLAGPLDFTADEQMVVNRDAAHYASTPAEALDRWRQRIKYDVLLLKSADKKEQKKEGQEALDKLHRRYNSFAKRMHQTNSEELLEIYLNAFTMSFDPHTDYMSPRSYTNFKMQMSLELEGIGASLMSEDGYTTIKRIVPGGPAAKDGRLKIDDKIIGVGQDDRGEIVDVVDMKLNDVVDMIRGKPNTVVRLEVVPANGSGKKVYKITREKVALTDSEAQSKIFDFGKRPDGRPYRIGVIDLPSFYRDTDAEHRGSSAFKSATHDVRVILDDFRSKGVEAVILDLSKNGGGALSEAISLTALFINDGKVVQVKDAYGQVHASEDENSSVAWSGPLVVVISKFSASASEILAGAIQDYHRGLIVGDHSTHGKGTVQSLLDLGQLWFRIPNAPSMGALKITMQQFYRPDGDSTQRRGVLADVELPSITTYLDVGENDLEYNLPFDKVAPTQYKRFDDVTPPICQQLRQLSEQRVAHTEKFQKVVRNITRYKEQKAKKYITLNEAKFLKERSEMNADREEEKAIDDLLLDNSIKRDYYLDEVMAVTADYLNLEQLAKSPQPPALGANQR